MRFVCWKCGGTVTHGYCGRKDDMRCPDCGTVLYRGLEWFDVAYAVAVIVPAAAMVWGFPNPGPLRMSQSAFAVPLALLAAAWALQPLATRWAYGLWTRHYKDTGAEWGRRELPCWKCGKATGVYFGNRVVVCEHCGTELYRTTERRWLAVRIVADAVALTVFFYLAYRFVERLMGVPYSSLLLLTIAGTNLSLLSFGGVDRWLYLRWLARYRAGRAKAPEPRKDWAVDWEAVRRSGDRED